MTVLVSRAGALALLGLLLLAAWALFGAPLAGQIAGGAEALAEQERLLARYRSLAAQEAELTRELADLGSRGAGEPLLLPGASEAQASAALQQRVKDVLERSGAPLIAVQPLATRAAGDFRRVGLKLQFAADTVSLQRLLHALEAGRPVVLVDSLQVRSRGEAPSGRPAAQPQPGRMYGPAGRPVGAEIGRGGAAGLAAPQPAPARDLPLDVTLDVSGFIGAGS